MSRAEEIAAVEPISDTALAELRNAMGDPCFSRDVMASIYREELDGLLARLDRAEAALAAKDAEVERLTAEAAAVRAAAIEEMQAALDGIWSGGTTAYARGRREMKIAAIDAIRALLPRVPS